jgi:hypothetical protein
MKPGHKLLAILFIAGAAARGQDLPAPNGPAAASPAELSIGGTLHYDLHYSETAQFGGGQDGQQWSIVSGDAGYANTALRLPFNMQYGGGYGLSWNGPPSAGNVYQHLMLSQGMVWRSWNLNASDNVSYTFETPTTGFSGVPGSGEPIGGTVTTPVTDQTILAQNTRSLDNFTTIAIGHRLDYATSLSLGGSWGKMIFIDNNGENSDTLAANAGLSRRLNARNSISGQYSFSRFNYGGAYQANAAHIAFSQGSSAQINFSRQWNPRIVTSVAAGPQWVSSSDSAITPSSTRFSMSVAASDTFKFGTGGVNYNHGTSAGSGFILGAESDVVGANFARRLGKNLNIGFTGSYMRTAALNSNQAASAKFGGAQASRPLGRYFSIFANYTAIGQSSSLLNSTNVLNSHLQIIGFGIGYSPRETHLKK